ncbi:hypothetical protein [Caulobacter mirabilis]|uniref:Zinc/iron-chelating domain-containing protein n=1 Tax=Caulobacter mirabilis TaxID=69666 RepID=A0A2D2ASW9_9CAUL|nr:hypothetical protein [Caulobacter mirabilis]ATQ41108.1 hypothetical protein CSW64_01140 [Caulobacter mirabilis]
MSGAARELPPPFGGLAPNRECGDCVVCCYTLNIDTPELRKPADSLCPHCTRKACGIYETRPNVCRGWFCLWRRIGAMPESARPDRCGVVFSIDSNRPAPSLYEHVYIVGRAINAPSDFDHPVASQAIDMFIRSGGLPVWLSWAGQKQLVYPTPAQDVAISSPEGAANPDLAAWAQGWLKAYKLMSVAYTGGFGGT